MVFRRDRICKETDRPPNEPRTFSAVIVFRTRQSVSRGGCLMLDAEDAMKLRGGNAEGVSVTRKHVPLSMKTLSMMVYPAEL